MDYAAASSYLLGTINETQSRRVAYRLERMHAFMHELGDPHLQYPTVHVGGTSGKGSTSMMIAAALQAAGKRTGLHTKPHLRSMTERARIDGVPISEERFGDLLGEMMPAIERTTAEHGRPTYYETLLALTLLYFAREHVDVAVVEVGLGGRLDGTNVLVPQVATITSVGFDHMDVLGDTIEAIAAEKAGIAKPGVPLVVHVDDPAAFDVIAAHAERTGAPLIDVRVVAAVDEVAVEREGQRFTIVTPNARYAIRTRMLGEFQRRNAESAIVTLEALGPALRPSVAQVESALANLVIPGRMEIYPGYPSVVFDIAHNAEKAQHLVASLRERFPTQRFVFVVAIGASKDAAEILRSFATLPGSFVFTSFQAAGREAINPSRLLRMAESAGTWGRSVADPIEALSVARRSANAEDVIVVTGSTFLVAELREWWLVAA